MRSPLCRSFAFVFIVAGSGCATTSAGTRTVATGPVPAASCKTHSRVISPATRAMGEASLLVVPAGYALTWTERVGEHGALRFLVVDPRGNPLSPSAEVVDRPARMTAPALTVEADGYRLSWREGEAQLSRPLDARGRPRADVSEAAAAPVERSPSRCVVAGAKLVCRNDDQRALELPATTRPIAEAIGPGAPALIAQDAGGLRLWLLACSAR